MSSAKRRKVATKKRSSVQTFGGPSAGDDRPQVSNQVNNPSSSGLSTRRVPPTQCPSLSLLCIEVFANNFRYLSDENHWEAVRSWVVQLPDEVAVKLFQEIQGTYPELLSHQVITTYFLRGTSVTLRGQTGFTGETLSGIARIGGKHLRSLEIVECTRFSDVKFASLIEQLPSLEVLNLRNCSKVGPKTAEQAGKCCRELRVVNFNFTAITAASLAELLRNCSKLEVLKIAAVQNITDATLTKLLSTISNERSGSVVLFPNLRTLKLRHSTLTEHSIAPFLSHCPSLTNLDVSFTHCRRLPQMTTVPPLEKLTLTSTLINGQDVVDIIYHLPNLKNLAIGALGTFPGTSSSAMSSTGLTLNDSALRAITDALQGCPGIEKVNLVLNSKLGLASSLFYFIQKVGRKCKVLNLTGISRLRSSDLMGLLPDENEPSSPLRVLLLNKTAIDEEIAEALACCPELRELEVAETKITGEGLSSIIRACPQLWKLNLTGCRSIKVADRRRFFESMEEHGNDE